MTVPTPDPQECPVHHGSDEQKNHDWSQKDKNGNQHCVKCGRLRPPTP